jgi:hypothetical protein
MFQLVFPLHKLHRDVFVLKIVLNLQMPQSVSVLRQEVDIAIINNTTGIIPLEKTSPNPEYQYYTASSAQTLLMSYNPI